MGETAYRAIQNKPGLSMEPAFKARMQRKAFVGERGRRGTAMIAALGKRLGESDGLGSGRQGLPSILLLMLLMLMCM